MNSNDFFFGQFYAFLRRQHILSKLGYNQFSRYLSGWSPRLFTARHHGFKTIAGNLRKLLDLSSAEVRKETSLWIKNFGFSAFNSFFYRDIDPAWVKTYIDIPNKLLFEEIIRNGGLLLTCHCHHHNTIGCVFGVMGAEVLGISAAKNPEFDHPKIRKYHIGVMHDESERKFGGGRYLFLNKLRQTLKDIHAGITAGKLVVGLADTPALGKKSITVKALGQNIELQRWLFDIAAAHGGRVYFAALESRGSQVPLKLSLDAVTSPFADVLAQKYMDFVIDAAKQNPSMWQGWEWFYAMQSQEITSIVCDVDKQDGYVAELYIDIKGRQTGEAE